MGKSHFFGGKQPVRPHLVEPGSGGLAGEIADLRRDVDEAFTDIETAISTLGVELVGKVAFDFTTGVENLLDVVTPPQLILRAAILVTTAFDGPGAHLSFGTTTDPSMLLDVDDSNLGSTGQVISDRYVPVAHTDRLLLTLNTNGSTQGAGFLLFRVR